MSKQSKQSLLDSIANEMHCVYLSDLKYIGGSRRKEIARIIQFRHPVKSASLSEWNDALIYMTGRGPEKTGTDARKMLMVLLRCKE